MKSQPRKRNEAFTIVELLVVVTLVAMLVGSFAIGPSRMMGKLSTESAAKDFYLAARMGRFWSLSEQKVCELVVDSTAGLFYLRTMVEDDEGLIGEQIIRSESGSQVQLPREVIFDNIEVLPRSGTSSYQQPVDEEEQLPDVIRFYPDGRSDNAVIVIGNGKSHYTISVFGTTGRARLYEGIITEPENAVIDLDIQE